MARQKKVSNVVRKSPAPKGPRAKSGVAKRSTKQRSSSTDGSTEKSSSTDAVVTVDRRRTERRIEEAVEGRGDHKLEKRAKVQRRRQIDPTTCERDYSIEEVEFMNALDEYKRRSGRMFPTCSEVLEVVRSMGYVKLSPLGQAALLGTEASDSAIRASED